MPNETTNGYFTYNDASRASSSTASSFLQPEDNLASRGPSLTLTRSGLSGGSGASNPFRDPSLDAPRPPIPSRPSEIHRELVKAMEEDELPAPVQLARQESGPRKAHEPPRRESNGLLAQFRTGGGWFAPVVPVEEPLTREQREAKEAERIKKLRETGEGKRRPNFMKRMSSGVEMFSFGGSSTSPSKQGGRERSQSIKER